MNYSLNVYQSLLNKPPVSGTRKATALIEQSPPVVEEGNIYFYYLLILHVIFYFFCLVQDIFIHFS